MSSTNGGSTNTMLKKDFRLDALDVVLFFLGMGATVAAASALKLSFGVEVGKGGLKVMLFATAFAAPMARRAIFGAPAPRISKTGVLWGLLGIVGMFALLAGVLAGGVCGISLMRALEAKPDFEAEVREDQGGYDPGPEATAEAVKSRATWWQESRDGDLRLTAIAGAIAAAGLGAGFAIDRTRNRPA